MTKQIGFDIFDNYATDPKKEASGARIQLSKDVFILVARDNNRNYSMAMGEAFSTHSKALEAGGQDADDLARDLVIGAMSKHILVGWEGPLMYKGQIVGDYTPELAQKFLQHKDFREMVRNASMDVDNFRYEEEEGAAKN